MFIVIDKGLSLLDRFAEYEPQYHVIQWIKSEAHMIVQGERMSD